MTCMELKLSAYETKGLPWGMTRAHHRVLTHTLH